LGSRKKKRPEIEPEDAIRHKALQLLDFRPRTKKELSDKLLSKGFSPSLVESLIERFEEIGLLDDRSFAIDRARAVLLNKGWGPRKLRADLSRKGIGEESIHESIQLAYSDITQEELIRRQVIKRYGSCVLEVGSTCPDRQKAFRFLLGRGFEPEKVKSVLGYY